MIGIRPNGGGQMTVQDAPDVPTLYLELMRNSLTRHGVRQRMPDQWPLRRRALFTATTTLTRVRWPAEAETMIGPKRLASLQECVETVIADNIPGDLIECGVWRGGASIMMRAALAAYGDESRSVWLADSFEGLPRPDIKNYQADKGLDAHIFNGILGVSEDEVRSNFARYGLLDDRVRFLRGWFKDTLPSAPIDCLSVLRLDGDLYESTIQALDALYPKLSPGGFCIIDDYHVIKPCRQAVADYRDRHGITEEIVDIDDVGVLWRRAYR